jgi:tetratricopeptide (TPR) repeat protein
VLRKLERWADAIESYEQAIKLKNENPLAWYGKSQALKALKRNVQARYALEKAAELGQPDAMKELESVEAAPQKE